jgi:hypothetical protein
MKSKVWTPINEFLKRNRAVLFEYGVPIDLLDDPRRFLYFVHHGYDAGPGGIQASGLIRLEDMTPANRARLADLVAKELGEENRRGLDPEYLRR